MFSLTNNNLMISNLLVQKLLHPHQKTDQSRTTQTQQLLPHQMQEISYQKFLKRKKLTKSYLWAKQF
jgi:hypothetical protein